jgi:alanyl-tRNA synthetase
MAYDVYVHKQGVEGVSALNPESPANEVATNASRLAIKKTTMLGYGKLLANRTINTVAQELKASGNEQLATQLAQFSKTANTLVALAATKGLAAVPIVINTTAEAIVRERSAKREAKIAEVETRLKGGRSNFSQGSVHFD